MPRYLVTLDETTTTQTTYRVEADDEETATELAESGEGEVVREEVLELQFVTCELDEEDGDVTTTTA